MQFIRRNNTEAITGFIQGIVMSYDAGNPMLHYFSDMQIIVSIPSKVVEIHTWTNEGQYMPIQSIILKDGDDIDYLQKQAELACEAIHEDYIRFFKK